MYSSDPNVTADFADFVDARGYLNNAEADAVKENADASSQVWSGSNVVTTEFCYSSNVFSIIATSKVENTSNTMKRVVEDDGTFDITANWGPTLNYWRELFP